MIRFALLLASVLQPAPISIVASPTASLGDARLPFGPDRLEFRPDFRPLAPTPRVRGPQLVAGERPTRTTISHVIYLNNCMPNGCTVRPGNDDSRNDTSSIASSLTTLSPYPWGDASWKALVACMQNTYSLFDLQIVTTDPGNSPHSEVMFGGKSTDFDPGFEAGGVAPYLSCGALEDNGLSFVFAAQTSNLDYLCWAGVQESSHVFGLDHQLEAKDPLTYLYPPYHKEFQDVDAPCGEERGSPRECFCGGPTQNTTKYLLDVFGPGTPVPPSLTITRPKNGAWVKPEFPIAAELGGRFLVEHVDAAVGGVASGSLANAPFVFNAPPSLAAGAQTITVSAVGSGTELRQSVSVKVLAQCTAGATCEAGFACLQGYCAPDASQPGGLGAACSNNEECALGVCASDGANKYCTAECDVGSVCPSGFSCLEASPTQSICWPNAANRSDGGCQTNAPADGGVVALGALWCGLLVLRRRQRP